MVKEFNSKKGFKKLKTIKKVKLYPKKKYRKKTKKIKLSQKKNLTTNISINDEMQKNFFDAQSSIKINCYVCNKSLVNQIKIILDPSYSKNKNFQKGLNFNALCVKCFVFKTKFNPKDMTNYVINEMTLNTYKFTNYKILNKFSENLFTKDWTLGQEIKLLGAIERLGLNNWEEISKILGKGKFECESHYYTFYYKSNNDFLPDDKLIILNTNNKCSKNISLSNKKQETLYTDKIKQNIGYIPFSENNKSNRSLSKNNIKKDENDKSKPVNQNMYDILGYWEKRKDYDVEYKNEAEIQMSEIEFNENDNKDKLDINYTSLRNYNNVLDEREERKNFVIEKNLFDVRKQINFFKKLSKHDKEIYEAIKYNMKYLTKEQFLFILESNILEKNIKTRLNQLLYYKNLGCNTYDDIQKYINEIKKENIKNKEENEIKGDDKMRLRNSTINLTNKLSEIQKNNKNKKRKNINKQN
jgi:transcriptional adapter 2-alpha